MTTRKSQRDAERYTTNKADQIGGEIHALRPDWTTSLEHGDCVTVGIPGMAVIFWFGPANETFGASIYAHNEDQGYIETNLDQNTETVDALAAAAVKGVEEYLRRAALALRVKCGDSEAVIKLAAELAETITAEVIEYAQNNDRILRARSFSDLHSFCDANVLGDYEQILDFFSPGPKGDEQLVQRGFDVMNAAQGIVDTWIKGGGLVKAGGLKVDLHERTWQNQFDNAAVPESIQKMVESKMIEDTSWGNDAMPSFEFRGYEKDEESERAFSKGKALPWTYRLWVNFEDPKLREFGDTRFLLGYYSTLTGDEQVDGVNVPMYDEDSWVDLLITNDLTKIEDAIRERFFQAYVWSDTKCCPWPDCESSDVEEEAGPSDYGYNPSVQCNECGRVWSEVVTRTMQVHVDEGIRQFSNERVVGEY